MSSITHYLPAFTSRKGALQEAVCGARITAKDHSAEPTCAKCAAWLANLNADEEATAQALEAEFPEYRDKLASR